MEEFEVQSSGIYGRVVKSMSTDISEVHAASFIRAMIALMIKAACTSETSVDIDLTTWQQYISED
jgi:hypothetical protein